MFGLWKRASDYGFGPEQHAALDCYKELDVKGRDQGQDPGYAIPSQQANLEHTDLLNGHLRQPRLPYRPRFSPITWIAPTTNHFQLQSSFKMRKCFLSDTLLSRFGWKPELPMPVGQLRSAGP